MKQVIIRVRAMLFGIDLRVERGVFGCDGLFMGKVHWSISFRWLTQDGHNKSRIDALVARLLHRLGGTRGRFAVDDQRG